MICRSCSRQLTRQIRCGSQRTASSTLNGQSKNAALLKSISSRNTAWRSCFRTFSTAENPPADTALEPLKKPTEMTFAEFDKLLPKVITINPPKAPIRSTSFVDYVNYSKTLRALIMLGVNLHKIETQHPKALEYLVTLDLRKDIKQRAEFLIEQGFLREEIGQMITKNPKILDPDKDIVEMKEIIDYLLEKKFSKNELLSVVVKVPTILTMSVPDLDGILGFYQRLETNRSERKIKFSNDELKAIILSCPQLIVSNLYDVYEQIRTLEVSCEFTLGQIRKLIYGLPHILIKDPKQLELLYKFYFREMGITNEELTDFPGAFATRIQIVLERHYYLKLLGRAQYKRDQPGYIALPDIYVGTDEKFCVTHRLGSVSDFKRFIKTQ